MAVLVVASVIMTVGFVVTVDEKYAGATDTAETATFLYSYEGGGKRIILPG